MRPHIMGRRARLVSSGLLLLALTGACGVGGEEESDDDVSTAAEALEETPPAVAREDIGARALTIFGLMGCWDGPDDFTECFRDNGAYTFSEGGVTERGSYRVTEPNRVEITRASGAVHSWTVAIDSVALTLTGGRGQSIMYVRHVPPEIAPPENQLVGCWRRTTGGATECYSADHTWATRRTAGVARTGPEPTTGTWRLMNPSWLELMILETPYRYGMVWSGSERITFIATDGREAFVRVRE